MAGLIVAITSAVALAWKIYMDIRAQERAEAKIDAIIKHVPDAEGEIKKIRGAWKAYQTERASAKEQEK